MGRVRISLSPMAARFTAFAVIAIVAVTFVAGLIVGAQREDDSGPVDLIVYNARVYTGNPEARSRRPSPSAATASGASAPTATSSA